MACLPVAELLEVGVFDNAAAREVRGLSLFVFLALIEVLLGGNDCALNGED